MPDDGKNGRSSADEPIEIYFEDEQDPHLVSAADRADESGGGSESDPNDAAHDDGAVARELDRTRAELNDLQDRYVRKLAEFDNFRKRTERERVELERTAGESLIREILPVLDNFERALQHSEGGADEGFRQGVEMISRQLWEVLQRSGVEVIDPLGELFRPELHEAVQRVEDPDFEPGTVAAVHAKGYAYGGRLVRPAMVAVSVEPSPADSSGGSGDSS